MSSNPIPQGRYKPAVRYSNFIFTSGMTPRKDGVLVLAGKIKADEPLETYREAIRQAAANALTAARNCLNEGEEIVQILSLTVYVVSEYLFEELGDRGIGARAAIGLATLPGDAPVEVQFVAAAE